MTLQTYWISWKSVQWKASWCMRTHGQTNRHQVNSRFLQFWERAQKDIFSVVGCLAFPQEGRARYWPASVEGSVVTTAVYSASRVHKRLVQSSKCRRICHYRPYQNRDSRGVTLHAVRLHMFPENEHNWDLRSSAIVLSEDWQLTADVSGQPISHGRPKISFTLRRKPEVIQGT